MLFGPMFARSGVGSWDVLVPGLLVRLSLMSAGLAGFDIFLDQRFGVLERLRVTPASRVSLLLGRVTRDIAVLLVQSALLLALGWAFGLRAPLAGALLGLALLLVLAVGLAPPWLDVLSRLTPFRHVVEALRSFFAGSYVSATVGWGVLDGLVFLVVGVAVGTRLFHRENA